MPRTKSVAAPAAAISPQTTIVGLVPKCAALKPITGEPSGVPPIKIIR